MVTRRSATALRWRRPRSLGRSSAPSPARRGLTRTHPAFRPTTICLNRVEPFNSLAAHAGNLVGGARQGRAAPHVAGRDRARRARRAAQGVARGGIRGRTGEGPRGRGPRAAPQSSPLTCPAPPSPLPGGPFTFHRPSSVVSAPLNFRGPRPAFSQRPAGAASRRGVAAALISPPRRGPRAEAARCVCIRPARILRRCASFVGGPPGRAAARGCNAAAGGGRPKGPAWIRRLGFGTVGVPATRRDFAAPATSLRGGAGPRRAGVPRRARVAAIPPRWRA